MLALQRRLAAGGGEGVSYEDLRVDLGLSSRSGVFRLVGECEARGRIRRYPRMPRSLVVVSPVPDDAPVEALARFADGDLLAEVARRGLSPS